MLAGPHRHAKHPPHLGINRGLDLAGQILNAGSRDQLGFVDDEFGPEAGGQFVAFAARGRVALPLGDAQSQGSSARLQEQDAGFGGAEQRHGLCQGFPCRFLDIEGLGRGYSDGVERMQFAIAAANLLFGMFLFRDVEEESLVSQDLSMIVAGGKTILQQRRHGTIFAVVHKLEIANESVALHFALMRGPVFGQRVEMTIQVQGENLGLVAESQHPHECFIAVQQFAARGRDEHALLHLFEKHPEALFRQMHVGGIADDVNRANFGAEFLGIAGGRYRGEAAETGIGRIDQILAGTQTIRAALRRIGKKLAAPVPQHSPQVASQPVHESAVGAQDSLIAIVHQDQIVDRIEGADPSAMGADDLLEELNILQRQAEMVGSRNQKTLFLDRVAALMFHS